MLLGRPRNAGADGLRLLRGRAIRFEGVEYLPRSRRFLLVMNHYERPGMNVWWPAFAVSAAAWEAQGRPALPLRWIITDRFYRYRLWRIPIPQALVSWFLARVAARYGLVLVARSPEAAASRAVTLRRMRCSLEAPDPVPVASTPEGERAGGRTLGEPIPSAGKSLAWLSRGETPVVPVVAFEEAGTLVVRFGAAFVLDWPGLAEARRQEEPLARQVMDALAALLPPGARGRFGP